MPTVSNLKWFFKSASTLGLAALTLNLLAYALTSSSHIPIGNIFLLWSAIALGLPGAIIAVALGTFPEVFLTDNYFYGIRTLVLCCSIGYVAQRNPKIPSFYVTAGLWLAVFTPARFLLSNGILPLEPLSVEAHFLSAFAETFLTAVAGACLLSPGIWAAVTQRPRHVEVSYLLGHAIALISLGLMTVSGYLLHLVSDYQVMNDSSLVHFLTYTLLFTVTVAVPALFTWLLRDILHELYSGSLLPGKHLIKFSGLSSDFWRRQLGASTNPESQENPWMTSRDELPPDEQGSSQSNEGICALDRNGTVKFVNDKFYDLLKLPQREVLGRKIDDLGVPSIVLSHINECLANQESVNARVTELKLNKIPDRLRFLEVVCEPAQTNDMVEGEYSDDGLIFTLRDITDRRTVESHLLQAQKLNSLGNLVGGLAHGFNNSLTAIVGQASFAQHSRSSKRVQAALGEIIETANDASKLVWKLLEFAEGRPHLVSQQDIGDTLAKRMDLLQKIVGDCCELELKLPEKPVGALCDMNLLLQAITNLVINSKEAYGEEGGPIRIGVETEEIQEEVSHLLIGAKPGKYVRIQVSDDGRGMNPEVLSHAFEPLFTTRSDSGHPGLGLSIVFAIVRAHDGFLTAESHSERGTTLSLYLPHAELQEGISQEGDRELSSEDTSSNTGNQERILVVEDEPTVRELVAKMLEALEYTVEACGSGKEALDLCTARDFDLVLVDLMMPKMGGVELVQELRAKKLNPKTLVMTGYGITQEVEEADVPVISKPFDMETLAESIRSTLSS